MRHLALFLFFTAIRVAAPAQAIWNWPEQDSALAVRMNARYTDALRDGSYHDTLEPLEWLLLHAPTLNVSIYINGVKIYEQLVLDGVKDSQVQVYKQRAMEIYDQRIHHFGNAPNVLQRKSLTAYSFWKSEPERYSWLLSLFKETLVRAGRNTINSLYLAKMDILRRMKLNGMLTDGEFLQKYDSLSFHFEHSINADSEKTRELLEGLFVQSVEMSCEVLEKWLLPRFERDRDTLTAKKVVSFFDKYGCLKSELLLAHVDALLELIPNRALCWRAAIHFEEKGNLDIAEKYYQQAIDFADTPRESYDGWLVLARYHQRQSAFRSSRSSARRALAVYPDGKEPYELIGDLYYSSLSQCKQGDSIVVDRSVFFAAYKMYKLSGNTEKMELARAQFPLMSEIFNELRDEGDVMTCNCWINEEVVVMPRN